MLGGLDIFHGTLVFLDGKQNTRPKLIIGRDNNGDEIQVKIKKKVEFCLDREYKWSLSLLI